MKITHRRNVLSLVWELEAVVPVGVVWNGSRCQREYWLRRTSNRPLRTKTQTQFFMLVLWASGYKSTVTLKSNSGNWFPELCDNKAEHWGDFNIKIHFLHFPWSLLKTLCSSPTRHSMGFRLYSMMFKWGQHVPSNMAAITHAIITCQN